MRFPSVMSTTPISSTWSYNGMFDQNGQTMKMLLNYQMLFGNSLKHVG